MNYDQKSQEAETKTREFNTVSDELSQKQSQLNTIQSDLQAIRESSSHQKKRVNEMLRSLLTDLGKDGEKKGSLYSFVGYYLAKLQNLVSTFCQLYQSLSLLHLERNERSEVALFDEF